ALVTGALVVSFHPVWSGRPLVLTVFRMSPRRQGRHLLPGSPGRARLNDPRGFEAEFRRRRSSPWVPGPASASGREEPPRFRRGRSVRPPPPPGLRGPLAAAGRPEMRAPSTGFDRIHIGIVVSSASSVLPEFMQ